MLELPHRELWLRHDLQLPSQYGMPAATDPLLRLDDVSLAFGSLPLLHHASLQVEPGSVHALMGPNGSGKSTLAYVLAGREGYAVTKGEILFQGKNLAEMTPEERAREGVFLGFQYPVEIPGVSGLSFLKAAVNEVRKHRGIKELDAMEFLKFVRAKLKMLEMGDDLLKRPINVGFSGGEKKRVEVLQMAVLEPRLAIMDETDSGLDIDALRVVSDGVNALKSPKRGFVVITHYQRLLNHIVPDFVHVLSAGKIVRSGGKELALELEKNGYAEFTTGAAA